MTTMTSTAAARSLLLLLCAALFLSLTGFECASTEMTTAKVAINAKDYKKAEESLKREVTARPQNSEAWILLAKIYEEQGRFAELNDAFDHAQTATQPPLTAEQREAIVIKRYNFWSIMYNAAGKARGAGDYQLAMRKIDTAITLRPDANENYYLQGLVAGSAGDSNRQMRIYEDYARRVRPDVDKGVASGLALGMSPADVQRALGTPTEEEVDSTGGWAYFAAKGLALYYAPTQTGEISLNGWRSIAAADAAILRRIPASIQSDVFYALGVEAYYAGERNRARYDDALNSFRLVEKLDPSYKEIGRTIAQIYITTGRTKEARERYEQEIRDNPNDPTLAINYGNFLINMKDYQGAIDRYQQAARVAEGKEEERFHQALFNLGAAYKNWGAELQDSIRKVTGSKTPTRQQEEVYMSKLRESVKQFERLREIKGTTVDFGVLFELANLYQVLGDNTKMKGLLGSLESMKGTQGESSAYWYAMSRLYANIGDGPKSESALSKAEALKAQGK